MYAYRLTPDIVGRQADELSTSLFSFGRSDAVGYADCHVVGQAPRQATV